MEARRILIVDDEPAIRDALRRWFTRLGFQVDAAEDGVTSVEMASANRYYLIIMDLEMPRMNGTQAIQLIKAAQPDLPILVLTGYSDQAEAALNAGAAKILKKPLQLATLEYEVRRILVDRPTP